jgi:hypothetical protein
MGGKFGPDGNNEVFYGAEFSLHEWHICIQILMVQSVYHMGLDDTAEFLHVKNEACFGVRPALDGDMKLKVVAMPVLIGTFAKNLFISFSGPGGIEQAVGCIEMFYPRDENHYSGKFRQS